MPDKVTVIGAGLAGCEAALQLSGAGMEVELHEMRPRVPTPAHRTGNFAELVCSNSFKGQALQTAHGLLKEELRRLGSRLIAMAHASAVPAGASLAVDRDGFSRRVEEAVAASPGIRVRRQETLTIDPEGYAIVATGPLTSPGLHHHLQSLVGEQRLYFFDAIAPVIEADSIDMAQAYVKNRWDKGDKPDFINCPLDAEQYRAFVAALRQADTIEAKPFEKQQLFEGCLPIEELARRGEDTLRFGPMRPVGLEHPITGKRPHAVLQLRAENNQGTLYNLVGCQTRLKQTTQVQIFSIIPALKRAGFARLGAMHRNTFINSPKVLDTRLNLPGTRIFFAGQLTGAEGYTEAIATGLYAASMVCAAIKENKGFSWPAQTCTASLVRHLISPNPDFQPMNMNFGLFDVSEGVIKSQRKQFIIDRCLKVLEKFRLPWQ